MIPASILDVGILLSVLLIGKDSLDFVMGKSRYGIIILYVILYIGLVVAPQSGSIFRESLKAFLELRSVVFVRGSTKDLNMMTHIEFEGTALDNQTMFLNLSGDNPQDLNNIKLNNRVGTLLRDLSSVGLITEGPGNKTMQTTTAPVKCDIHTLTEKGLELALQCQSIDDSERRFRDQSEESEKRFDKQIKIAYTTIAVAIIIPVVVELFKFLY